MILKDMTRIFSILTVVAASALGSSVALAHCRSGGCTEFSQGIAVGEPVYNVSRNSDPATVIAIQPNGKFVLRFSDGIGGGWSREDLAVTRGCNEGICTGDVVYNVNRNSDPATAIAIQTNGKFVLRFDDGVGGGWSSEDLAKTKGCSRNLCVGQKVIDVSRNSDPATVIAIQTNGKFVLRFDDGVGGGWSFEDLACI